MKSHGTFLKIIVCNILLSNDIRKYIIGLYFKEFHDFFVLMIIK